MKKIALYLKLVLIFIGISSTIFIMYSLYVNSSKLQNKIIGIQIEHVKGTVNGFFDHKKDEYIGLSYSFFNHKSLKDSLKNQDRNQFYNDIYPSYEEYKKTDPSLWGIHIILANGCSFLRVHSPQTKDDFVSDRKALIKKTITTQKLQSGFELGKFGHFFRVIYPIFDEDNSFLAVAEMSFKIDVIIDDIKGHFDYDLAFLFKNNIENKTLIEYKNKTNDDYIIQYTTSKYITKSLLNTINKKDNDNIIHEDNNQYYKISVLDLENTKYSPKLVVMHNVSNLIKQRTETFYRLLIIVVLMFSFGVIVVILSINFFLKKIEQKEEETVEKTKELYFKSRHNSISNLPNLNIIIEDITSLEHYSILMLNIDNTAIFNTTYGPKMVDMLIKEGAKYLQYCIPSNGTLYHINSDEFIILLDKPVENQEILLASEIKSYFEHTPLHINDVQAIMSFSFGIAKHSENNELDMYSKANIALVEAKHRGHGLILMYNESMSDYGSYTQLAKNIAILQRDLEDENLIPFFQPIVDNNTKEVVKYEVLARVKDGDKFLSPYHFMDAAKVSGLETAITRQIIQKSFKYFESTSTAFSINITKHDLLEQYLINFLDIKVKKHNIDPKNVTLEILEDIVIEDDKSVIKQINDLHSLGFVIAIDDFGVESSNMSRITDLNIDFIKIDGSFIKDLDTNEKHLKIVEALVYMGDKLDVKIIAEFVHNEEIYNIVKSLGIPYSQGYYFSEPKEFV